MSKLLIKDKSHCMNCYWAYPENYTHIALRDIRRLDLLWAGSEVGRSMTYCGIWLTIQNKLCLNMSRLSSLVFWSKDTPLNDV